MLRKALRRFEGGAGTTAQVVIYTFALFAAFALVYDLGNVALVAQIANTAARTAALDAAKEISSKGLSGNQRIALEAGASARAESTVHGLVPATISDLSISVNGAGKDASIDVFFRVRAATPIMNSVFGLQGINLPAHGSTSMLWGSEGEKR